MVDQPLLIVSNRGPLRFVPGPDGELAPKRGGGGLVTALSALTATRPITWVASALTDGDAEVAARGHYRDGNLTLRLLDHDREEYDRYYNVFANPTLWFVHHYLWSLALEPSVDRNVRLAWEAGYVPVNERFSEAAAAEVERMGGRTLVMVHDYQLFMVPGGIRSRAPDAVIHHFTHIPWPQPDYWRVLPTDVRRAIHESMLMSDVIGLHTPRYVRSFLQCCERFAPDAQVDIRAGEAEFQGRRVRVRAYPISVDPAEFERLAASEAVVEAEAKVTEVRPEKLIVRVDRTDPSKNVVRGFSAFDLFLSDHPEWQGRVTMLALLDPSRGDIPEYAEYVGAIQRAARAVNDRYYTSDEWLPVDLRISDNFPEAVAAYKHYDVLLVNAIFDGMNLIAKEAPLVNGRDGVLILSENTGAHAELGRFALCVNPFDIQAQADAIHQALVMPEAERHQRIEGIRSQVRANDINRWIQLQLDDLAEVRPEAVAT
ncbi:MAG TPA: trehalose-6-phosphate synthase [Gaiellales bacterium]|jgi:trehalose 6-phosphate synthase|nr:trehalose-6-phosphate synthase [Gaiellales bacterium]